MALKRPSGQPYSPLVCTGLNLAGLARSKIIGTRVTQVSECTIQNRASPKFSSNGREVRLSSEYWLANQGGFAESSLQAIKDFCGYSGYAVDGSGTILGLDRVIPYPHPSAPNYLYAEVLQNCEGDVPLEAGQDGKGVSDYDEGKVSVVFGSRDHVIGDNGLTDESKLRQYVKIRVEPTGRYERVPTAGYLRWLAAGNGEAANTPVSNASAVVFCEAEIFITWYQVPVGAIPWNAISTCVGCADLGLLQLNGQGASHPFLRTSYLGPVLAVDPSNVKIKGQPRFLCLVPKVGDSYQMADGNFAVDITYHFKFYPFGVNSFYRWRTAQFELAYVGFNAQGTPQYFFQEADFATLWYGKTTPDQAF